MFKKIDQYLIKTFFGPFLFIFSVLFFIFIVNIVWIQMFNLAGKGLSTWELAKFFYYLSVNVVKMVLPLTILLASIMTFGGFGERYELAAMKSAGISLLRIMRPLLITIIGLSFILFLFSNYVIPDFQRKAKNMMYNIASTKPALNFTPGQFINSLPGASVKFDKIYGKNDENIEGVFVHKTANNYEDQRTIIAKKGKFVPAVNSNYLKLVLYDGYIFEDELTDVSYQDRYRQKNQAVKFDTLVSHFDVSEIINKAIEHEKITDDYAFQDYLTINKTIDKVRKDNKVVFENIASEMVSQSNNYVAIIDDKKPSPKPTMPFKLDTIKTQNKLDLLYAAYNRVDILKQSKISKENQLLDMIKFQAKVIMYQQQILTYSFTCILFFLIGSSLGSIIRKGGMGLPVVIAIIIFVLFYLMNLSVENVAWKGQLNPYVAAWLPNFVLLPFAIWLTHKALTDSQIFDIEKYKALAMPIIKRFSKQKEHERYQ